MFCFEMLVTFGSAKSEYFAVVSDKHHAVPRIDGSRTKITFLYSHFNNKEIIINKPIPFISINFMSQANSKKGEN